MPTGTNLFELVRNIREGCLDRFSVRLNAEMCVGIHKSVREISIHGGPFYRSSCQLKLQVADFQLEPRSYTTRFAKVSWSTNLEEILSAAFSRAAC